MLCVHEIITHVSFFYYHKANQPKNRMTLRALTDVIAFISEVKTKC